jgi:light-regulated signal transduction histidine kinase (bacteriophytochrome)
VSKPLLDPSEKVDLTNCDREPIHIVGQIQPFGCLLAITSDWIVAHASRNCQEMLGLEEDGDLLGRAAGEFLGSGLVDRIKSRLAMLQPGQGVERLFSVPVRDGSGDYDIAIHLSGNLIVLEFEKSSEQADLDYTGFIRPMIDRASSAENIERLMDIAVRQIRMFTGLDRVMVYKFAEDDSGEVVAEARRDDMEPFLHLRYPASDIPKQVRELCKKCLVRTTGDATLDGVDIVPTLGPDGNPLDLTLSTTRAVSPIHREYLGNMGIRAT